MATEYFISQINPETKDRYQPTDTNNSNVFEINSSVDLVKDKIETHFLDLDFNLIDSIYDSRNIQTSQDSEIAIDGKPSSIQLNPTDDAINNGFKDSSVIISYNFLKNLFSETKLGGRFFIETISEDRTELRLLSTELSSEEIVEYSDSIIKEIESTSYFNDFRLNIGDNKLYIAVNIKTEDYREYKAVLVKLYQPLPDEVEEKTILTIEQKVADSVAYEVNAVFTPDVPKLPFLKGPNFIITEEESASPTSFLNYQELFDFPVNNSYRELNSLFKEKSINLSIDYSDFANFAHFSSVEERLRNFQYKLNLIEEYQVSSSQAAIARESGSTTFTSGSDLFWKGKLDGIINNFDHYDRHLYFGSGSTSWPKQDPQEKPYIQATGSATGSFVTEYFGTTVSSASVYDDSNANLLINTVPEYIRDDADSAQYSTFIHMLAQHFDNLYIYSKALSDKYDNDNRLDFGASKDLIQDLLKNFGVKIYNNVRSAESLFDIYSGQTYQTGSDVVTDLISASNTPISTENYRNDIHKRVYHNLPYLLKTKGTERGLKALIASFGLPTDNNIIGSGSNINGLYVRTFGGGTTGSFNAGPLTAYTSSLGKIRTDDTGSIVSGNTLSQYATIITRDKKYSDDIHSIEVGYSPTYELDDKIISASTTGFNIDNLIGDPGIAFSSSYQGLESQSLNTINSLLTSDRKSHNYGELVRYLTYYDNVLFKMIKDFVPARANVDTGLIIKPHILERNKIKQVQGTFIEQQYTGSIDTAFTTGSDGSAFTNKLHQELTIPLTASYSESIVTSHVSGGLVTYHYHEKERTRYDGEFSGSHEFVYEHSLNDANDWKYESPTNIFYKPIGVEKISCPTITISSFTTSSSSEFIFSGSYQATGAGNYTVDIEYNSASIQVQENVVTNQAQSGEGTISWNYSTTSSYAAGTWHPTASIQLSGSDCGTVVTTGTALTISEVCPQVNLTGLAAVATAYGAFDPATTSSANPTGLQLNFTASIAETGSGISEVGYVISTNATPTVSSSANKHVLSGSGDSNLAKVVLDAFITPNMSQSVDPTTHTYLDFGETYYVRAYVKGSSTCGDSNDIIYSSQQTVTTPADARPAPVTLYFGQPTGNPPQNQVCAYILNNTNGTSGSFYTWMDGQSNNGFGDGSLAFAMAEKIFTYPVSHSAALAETGIFYGNDYDDGLRFFSGSNELLGTSTQDNGTYYECPPL